MALFQYAYVAPAQVLVQTMPINAGEQRVLRATIRRWARAMRDAGYDLPDA